MLTGCYWGIFSIAEVNHRPDRPQIDSLSRNRLGLWRSISRMISVQGDAYLQKAFKSVELSAHAFSEQAKEERTNECKTVILNLTPLKSVANDSRLDYRRSRISFRSSCNPRDCPRLCRISSAWLRRECKAKYVRSTY